MADSRGTKVDFAAIGKLVRESQADTRSSLVLVERLKQTTLDKVSGRKDSALVKAGAESVKAMLESEVQACQDTITVMDTVIQNL